MKLLKKRWISIILLLLFGFTCIKFSTVGIVNAKAAVNENDLGQQTEQDDLYSRAMDLFSRKVQTDEEETVTYTDDFGGVFIDDDGKLNIGVVSDNAQINKLKKTANFDGQVVYKAYAYSYNYLQELKDVLAEVMIEYDIYTISIRESLNRVCVYSDGTSEEKDIIAYLRGNGYKDIGAIEFITENEHELSVNSDISENSTSLNALTSANMAYAGDEIQYQEGSDIYFGAVGANVRCNQTGKMGVITNDHVAKTDKTMFVGRNLLGVKARGQHSGTIDAAFVPFADQNAWETTPYAKYGNQTFNNIRLGNEGNIVEGQKVTRIGRTTGLTEGQIISRDSIELVQYDDGVKSIANCFRCDNAGARGDSGGPIYFNDGKNLFLIGLTFTGEESSFTSGCRISEIMRILDVTPVTNDPLALGMDVVSKGTAKIDGKTVTDWGIKLSNYNDFSVNVKYNSRMCFKDDAAYFRNLDPNHLAERTIAANSFITEHIYSNGTAGWITAGIDYTADDGIKYRMISYTNGLSQTGLNPPYVNWIIAEPMPAAVTPDYLKLAVTGRYGFIWYDWDIEISNPNAFDVSIEYNQKMCFQNDAKEFKNLSDVNSMVIPKKESVTVRINNNNTAGWITTAICYEKNGYIYKRISYAHELQSNPYKLTQLTNEIKV